MKCYKVQDRSSLVSFPKNKGFRDIKTLPKSSAALGLLRLLGSSKVVLGIIKPLNYRINELQRWYQVIFVHDHLSLEKLGAAHHQACCSTYKLYNFHPPMSVPSLWSVPSSWSRVQLKRKDFVFISCKHCWHNIAWCQIFGALTFSVETVIGKQNEQPLGNG